jgi:hypothetical protein
VEALPLHIQRSDLLAEGINDNTIRARKRNTLEPVRRGVYVPRESWTGLDSAARHRVLVTSTLGKLSSGAAVSHFSAAAIHGLPIVGAIPNRVHVTRQGVSGGYIRGQLHTHVSPLTEDLLTTVDDLVVTSVVRTLLDCALTGSFEAAVAMIDYALHNDLVRREDLAELVSTARKRPGTSQATRAVEFADHRSESPGESLSRVCFAKAGLPTPDLQLVVLKDRRFVGRSDFAWEDFRTLGEFDGKVKYGRSLLRPDQDIGDVVLNEKKREDELRELGWEVVRWIWSDLSNPAELAKRVRRAFARGVKRA